MKDRLETIKEAIEDIYMDSELEHLKELSQYIQDKVEILEWEIDKEE